MKTVLNYLAAYSTDILIHLITIAARKIKKKLSRRKIEGVEANKS